VFCASIWHLFVAAKIDSTRYQLFMNLRWFALLILTVLSLHSAESSGEAFTYKKVDDREMKLFVFKPADWTTNDLRPAIVFFHGGGWVAGAASIFDDHCQYFASRGLVTVTVDYRLIPKDAHIAPEMCVQDAKSAMRWVRSHAKDLGIDPKRIAAAGGSAGGHLAAFVGMVEGMDDKQDDLSISPRANAMILYNPVFNNGPGEYGYGRVGERYKEFSPAHNITADDPPATVFLGTQDHLIPVKTAQAFQDGMKKVGVRCDLHLYEGQKHGFYSRTNPKYFYETVLETDRFLASLGWLKGKPTLTLSEASEAAKKAKGAKK
jgi:acetyl esterase/lipase